MKKILIVAGIAVIVLLLVYLQFDKSTAKDDPRGDMFAGPASCVKCHGDISASWVHTAHYIASSPANFGTVHGNFSHDSNVFNISTSQKIIMEKRGGSMYQTYYLNGKMVESHRFDIVLGGVKGESYLFWKGNGLYQLPISYYARQHQWLMSPGYAPGQVDFNRIITKRCLECHGSFIDDQPNAEQSLTGAEQFDKSTAVLRIDCERCHGPAAQHVEFQTENPQIKTAHFIKTYISLTRAMRLDMCAQCHSGNKSEMIRSIFYFMPGDTLARFKLPNFYSAINSTHLDVHGNQLQLLQTSKCFINSKMDCGTCHNPHQNQRGNELAFVQKCLNCHTTVNHNYCKMANAKNAQFIKSNCIQCHMPALTTNAILSPNMDKTFSAGIAVHTHHIAIYPAEVKRILSLVTK